MHRQDRQGQLIAYYLAGVAGFVDAVGFVALGGFFVSFMSGNTTRMAVGVVRHGADAAMAGALILAFFIGVVTGTLIARMVARRWPGRRALALLSYVAVLLAMAGAGQPCALLPALCAAMAMGALNALFERDGEVRIGLTYMTGTLVRAGQHVANALTGGPRGAWAPWAMLWASLASGAVLGAWAWPALGMRAFWLAAGAVTLGAIRLRAQE